MAATPVNPIVAAREACGLTVEDVAAQADAPVATVVAMENGAAGTCWFSDVLAVLGALRVNGAQAHAHLLGR